MPHGARSLHARTPSPLSLSLCARSSLEQRREGREGRRIRYSKRSSRTRDSTHGQLVTLTTLVLFLDQTGDPTFARALTPRGTNGRKKGGTERGIRSGCSTRRG